MIYQNIFLCFFVNVTATPFAETKVICDVDKIEIIAANFDYLSGLKIILGDEDQTSGDEGSISNCIADTNRTIMLTKESTKRWNFGCGMKLINLANDEGLVNYQWKGVLKYVRKESGPVNHIIRAKDFWQTEYFQNITCSYEKDIEKNSLVCLDGKLPPCGGLVQTHTLSGEKDFVVTKGVYYDEHAERPIPPDAVLGEYDDIYLGIVLHAARLQYTISVYRMWVTPSSNELDPRAVYLVGRRNIFINGTTQKCAYVHPTVGDDRINSPEFNALTGDMPHLVFKIDRKVLLEAEVYDEVFIHYETKVCVADEPCDLLCPKGIDKDTPRMLNDCFAGDCNSAAVPLPTNEPLWKDLKSRKINQTTWNFTSDVDWSTHDIQQTINFDKKTKLNPFEMQILWQNVLLENRDKIDFMMQEYYGTGYSNREKRSSETWKLMNPDGFEQVSFGPFQVSALPISLPKPGKILLPFKEYNTTRSILFINICSSVIFFINFLLTVNLYKLRFNKNTFSSK